MYDTIGSGVHVPNLLGSVKNVGDVHRVLHRIRVAEYEALQERQLDTQFYRCTLSSIMADWM